jgi:hypothetical protein
MSDFILHKGEEKREINLNRPNLIKKDMRKTKPWVC